MPWTLAVWLCGEWNKACYFQKCSTCSCCFVDQLKLFKVCSVDGRSGGSPLSAFYMLNRRYHTFQARMCVFLCTCLNLYDCGSTSCKRVCFFSLSPSAAYVKWFLLYVGLSTDAPCYMKRPHPFQNTIPTFLHGYSIFSTFNPLCQAPLSLFFFFFFPFFFKCKKKCFFFFLESKKKWMSFFLPLVHCSNSLFRFFL